MPDGTHWLASSLEGFLVITGMALQSPGLVVPTGYWLSDNVLPLEFSDAELTKLLIPGC